MPRVSETYPSKYLVAADLRGTPRTYTITFVEEGTVGQGDDAKQQLLVTFSETDKPLGLNKTNATAIVGLYGDDTDDWIGEPIILFPTRVDFSGKMVDAIRVDERHTRVLMQAKLKAALAATAGNGKAKTAKPVTQAEIDAEIGPEPDADQDIPF